jgi:ABC-type uncharacterized transport system permease subunit
MMEVGMMWIVQGVGSLPTWMLGLGLMLPFSVLIAGEVWVRLYERHTKRILEGRKYADRR